MTHYLALAEWRRATAEMYSTVRKAPHAGRLVTWQDWRARRNLLFADHPQSPLTEKQRRDFKGLDYFDYDPAPGGVMGQVIEVDPECCSYEVLATSFDEFLSLYSNQLKAG